MEIPFFTAKKTLKREQEKLTKNACQTQLSFGLFVKKSFLLPLALLFAVFQAVGLSNLDAQLIAQDERFPYKLEVWQSGLEVPWQIVFSGNKAYFTERGGRIRVVVDGKLQEKPWANVPASRLRGEGGLLGIALHPNFSKNRQLFVAYTTEKDNAGPRGTSHRLVVFTESRNNRKELVGTQNKILVKGIPGGSNHNGGTLKIGPDRLLYWSIGDRYDEDLAQNIKSYNGKILRLTLAGTVPKSNPFANSHVFSLGHRNPQGIAFHPALKSSFLSTEHGPSGGFACCRDELNWVRRGVNYGWPLITAKQTRVGMEVPLIHSGTSTTWAPGGAVFVSSGRWKDSLLFTALRGSALYRVTFSKLANDGVKVATLKRSLFQAYGRLRDIAAGPENYYYLLTSNKDGRGRPTAGDDRILRFKVEP